MSAGARATWFHWPGPTFANIGQVLDVTSPHANAGAGTTALVRGPTDDDRAAATRRVADASADTGPIDRQRDLHGLVTGPGGAPLAGAEVTASASVAEGYSLLDRPLRRAPPLE